MIDSSAVEMCFAAMSCLTNLCGRDGMDDAIWYTSHEGMREYQQGSMESDGSWVVKEQLDVS